MREYEDRPRREVSAATDRVMVGGHCDRCGAGATVDGAQLAWGGEIPVARIADRSDDDDVITSWDICPSCLRQAMESGGSDVALRARAEAAESRLRGVDNEMRAAARGAGAAWVEVERLGRLLSASRDHNAQLTARLQDALHGDDEAPPEGYPDDEAQARPENHSWSPIVPGGLPVVSAPSGAWAYNSITLLVAETDRLRADLDALRDEVIG